MVETMVYGRTEHNLTLGVVSADNIQNYFNIVMYYPDVLVKRDALYIQYQQNPYSIYENILKAILDDNYA